MDRDTRTRDRERRRCTGGRSTPALPALGAVGLAALTLSSCVTQQKYDEALDQAKYYQRSYHDLAQYQPELQAENQRLRDELALYTQGGEPVPAAFTEDIDRRMVELQSMLDRIEGSEGVVTVFEVDGGYGYSLRDSVLFDTASTEVREEGRAILAGLAGEIARAEYRRIWVRGHTDSVPIVKPATAQRFPHGNLQLSAARALEVAALLIREGPVDSTRVAVAGFGPNEPVATNDTAEGRQRNRRVEIYVLEPESSEPEVENP